MRTLLATHAWLDCPIPGYAFPDGRCRRLERWLKYYQECWSNHLVVDNGSTDFTKQKYSSWTNVVNLWPHYTRQDIIHYPNVWRAYWYLKEMFQHHDKIIYIATDARIVSQRLLDYVESLDSGWTAFWSPKYRFPEPCIQVITKCKEFEDFFSGECDPFKYNGRIEETTLPFTHIERDFVGDRYGEYHESEIIPPMNEIDYYCQVSDSPEWDDSVFPKLIRQDSGKAVVK